MKVNVVKTKMKISPWRWVSCRKLSAKVSELFDLLGCRAGRPRGGTRSDGKTCPDADVPDLEFPARSCNKSRSCRCLRIRSDFSCFWLRSCVRRPAVFRSFVRKLVCIADIGKTISCRSSPRSISRGTCGHSRAKWRNKNSLNVCYIWIKSKISILNLGSNFAKM